MRVEYPVLTPKMKPWMYNIGYAVNEEDNYVHQITAFDIEEIFHEPDESAAGSVCWLDWFVESAGIRAV
tara:strand:+ start:14994 stop:15200 length:207 start_codon:yes stop_codon:yes gene_type:complete